VKKPFQRDDPFLTDVARTRERIRVNRDGPAELAVWWLGQSGYLILWNDRFLLVDPYLSDSLTRKYAKTDKPHVRISEIVIAPERLDFVDVVTSSHNHTDHLDPDTLQPLAAANPRLILACPEANRATARERSGLPDDRIVGLDHPGPAMNLPPFRLHPMPAAHEALERDAAGRLIYLGYVIEAGPFRIYHSGDTVLFDGQIELLREHRVDLALLPINGRAPERRVAGNLRGAEAAQLARAGAARLAVPCHYDLFAFNTASPDEFEAACQRFGQAYHVLRLGEKLILRHAPSDEPEAEADHAPSV
jgi:L-ascorbate metabolism protein UlaG (beta-lactamase superfamily)